MANQNSSVNPTIKNWFAESESQQNSNSVNPTIKGWFGSGNTQVSPLDDTAISLAQKDEGDQSYDNYCEQFAEQAVYGHASLYPTAADAYANYKIQGVANDGNITKAPQGALVYFAPDASNSGEGHVGISDGNGNFVSATSNGVKTISIKQWESQTGQSPLGWVTPPANPAPNQITTQTTGGQFGNQASVGQSPLGQAIPAGFNMGGY